MCKCLEKVESVKVHRYCTGIDDISLHKLALRDNLTMYFPDDYSSNFAGKSYRYAFESDGLPAEAVAAANTIRDKTVVSGGGILCKDGVLDFVRSFSKQIFSVVGFFLRRSFCLFLVGNKFCT